MANNLPSFILTKNEQKLKVLCFYAVSEVSTHPLTLLFIECALCIHMIGDAW